MLRAGVLASGALMVLGLTLLWRSGDSSCPFGVLTLEWVIWGDPFLQPSHVLFLGFLILVGTPVVRVAASVVTYAYERDWVFVAITGTVLLVLMGGMVLG